MHEPQIAIGPLMKAARKFKKFNQAMVAHAMGCSQSALSKMEHNLLTPSAPQWFLFSRFTAIPPEAIETGVIVRHSPVKLNDESVSAGFKLPRHYRINRSLKVREIYPLLTYFEKKIDGKEYEGFLKGLNIEPEFFLDFDNLVNFQFVVDLINQYRDMGIKKLEEIKKIITFGQDSIYWDNFTDAWDKLAKPYAILCEFAKQQSLFQVDFKIHVEQQDGSLFVSYLPEPHLNHFLKGVVTETINWLNQYRQLTLENLIRKTLGFEIEARPVAVSSNLLFEARFEIH